jgi:hypothetical protein
MWFLNLFTSILGPAASLINKWQDVRAKLAEMLHQKELTEIDAQMQSLIAEMKGESWLQRNWRPLCVLSMSLLVVYATLHNAFLIGYEGINPIEISERMWDLIQLSLSGYMGLRTVEKIVGKR